MDQLDWATIGAAAIAAVVARGATHPIDTLKVRLQTAVDERNGRSLFNKGWREGFMQIIRTEGIGALYRGFAMSLTFCIPATILYLCTYEAFRNNANFLGNPETSSLIHFIGGALAEIISNVFWCPMEVVKGRQQAAIKATPPPRTGYVDQSSGYLYHDEDGIFQSPSRYEPDLDDVDLLLRDLDHFGDRHPSPAPIDGSYSRSSNPSDMTTWGFCSDIFRRQGLTGFFVGFWFGILVYLPYSVIYFVFYEDFKNFFAGEKGQSSLSSLNIMLCSAAASAIAAAVTNLIDVPKTAYQVAKDQESNASLSFREYVTTMWQREGFWGFTRGMGARVAWMVPSTVIQFTIFEAVRSRFRQS